MSRAPVVLELPIECGFAETEFRRRPSPIASDGPNHRCDVIPLDSREWTNVTRNGWIGNREPDVLRKVLDIDTASPREYNGAFHYVLQFAHVARPRPG